MQISTRSKPSAERDNEQGRTGIKKQAYLLVLQHSNAGQDEHQIRAE